MSTSRDGEEDILVRISKANQAFASLRATWRSKNISQKTKIRFFKTNVLSTLLYGAESWKMTKTISHKLEVFQNKCLRRILRIYWPQTISNYESRRRIRAEPITQQVRRKRWKWIGHVLRMPPAALPRVALRWRPLMAAEKKADRKKHGEGQLRRDEGEQLDMGSPGTTSFRQKPMAHSGGGLMCFETRRGLSK